MKDLLIIQFAKWPVLGNVKTRLACSVGDTKALSVHMELMGDVLNTLTSARFDGLTHDIELWLNEIPDNKSQMTQILKTTDGHKVSCKVQKGSNLGDKMADAIASSLQRYAKVLIVGSDCPNITEKALRTASLALNATDIVLGPAEDGGYVLIGASKFNAQVFKEVAWGEGKVFDKTVSNIRALNLSYSLLDESWDVDDLADYERWCKLKKLG